MTRLMPVGGPVGVAPGAGDVEGGAEPVGLPFPDVAAHVVEAEAVGVEGFGGGCGGVAVVFGVGVGEVTLPDVAHIPAAGGKVVTPGVGLGVESAAGGHLPFGLGGQTLACPAAVCLRVVPGYVGDGVVTCVG